MPSFGRQTCFLGVIVVVSFLFSLCLCPPTTIFEKWAGMEDEEKKSYIIAFFKNEELPKIVESMFLLIFTGAIATVISLLASYVYKCCCNEL
jgi:ABC-type sulfate transport system permease component